ncbi:hypothetical protein GCM10020000_66020 [Streptomyces olivoverticillatus]
MASTDGVAEGETSRTSAPSGDQGRQTALGDLAAAEDDDAAPGETQSDGVGGNGCRLGHGAGLLVNALVGTP